MASLHTPPSLHLKEKLHLNSIIALVSLVNHHINHLLSNPFARKSLHLQCTSTLTAKNGAPTSFEFSDHSVLSSLYWGIKNLELAVQAKTPEDKADRLANSEKMLQIPALLDEDGSTLGVANRYMVCCTYFYLCLVRKLKGDEWQMTMHFLQSVLASPGAVKTEFAPELWKSLFRPLTTDEEVRQQARRYKDWLMYYRVVSYGEAPPIHGSSHLQLLFMDRYRNFGSSRCLCPVARELKFTMLQEVSISRQPINTEGSIQDVPRCPMQAENFKADTCYQLSSRSYSAISNLNFSILDLKGTDSNSFSKCYIEEETTPGRQSTHGVRCFRSFSSRFIELLGKFEKAVSTICITEDPGYGKDADLEVATLWELLNSKTKVKYSAVKQQILDQLMNVISTSRKEKVIRASVSILSVLISEDKTIIEGIKRKDLHLFYLASALKRNVHEAAIVIYMLNPSPSEIKSLELLPALVEVACNSNSHNQESISLPVTPTAASIAMIEILVTGFDYVTNNMHLAAISSPQILSKFVNVAMNKNLEEGIVLTGIFVRCMRLNGNCKKFLCQITPVDPFLYLLRSNESRAKSAALEYFHEILRIPRSSAIHLLRQIQQQGGVSIMHTLMNCTQQAELQHRLLAANLLLQLDMLEGPNPKRMFREEAMQILLEVVASEDNSSAQALSAFVLANLGGTYSWTGESYTAARLAKKTGLTSAP